MQVYLVERIYRDPARPPAVMSVWSSPERAQTWADRHAGHDTDSHLEIRVEHIDATAAAS